jgi:hypothetical protein
MSQESYPYTPPPTGAQNSGMAIGSLIASILGVTLIPTIGSIIGLILGYLARKEIRESGGTVTGDGMATAGIIIGWVGVGFAAIGICLGILALLLGIGIPGIAICAELGNTF